MTQQEAADAMGLKYWQSTRLIILPQALKISIPGIVNTFIGLYKDTTLVINTPSGEWICDDDSSTGVNPGVGFKAPEEGLYDIWVGRYEGGASGTATLNISEATFPQD